jgi:homoserine dehydrogenase
VRLAILGAGAVGRAVATGAADRGHVVTAIADSSGAAVDESGIDVAAALERKADRGSVGSTDPEAALDAPADAVVEATPTTLGDAEPGFSHATRALDRDRHVVLANKGPVAQRYTALQAVAADSAGQVRFEATVAGAVPVISTVEGVGPAHVERVSGVLNGTANFVLTRMAAEGLAYEHVLAEAQDLGVAEADPSTDVDGTDAALKCAILANVLEDGGWSLEDVAVSGIRDVPGSAMELAAEDGRAVRLVGEVGPQGPRVGPRLVPADGPLAVSGTQNAVVLETDTAGRLSLTGRGAGGPETASAVFADLARLAE